MRLKIPPLALTMLLGLGIVIWSKLGPAIDIWSVPYAGLIGIGSCILGWAIVFSGVWRFRRQQTTMDPRSPGRASQLVTSGIYRLTRNPMYLGFLLFLLGLAWVSEHWLTFFVPFGFWLYMNQFQIKPEEEALVGLFGEVYQQYCQRVPRWLVWR